MTQNANEQQETFTQAEVKAAEAAEQASLSASQNQYLTRRVVVLRTQLNRLEQENQELRLKVHALESAEQALDGTPEPDPENSPEG